MTNIIYTDKTDQYIHFTYSERVVNDNISITILNVETSDENEFIMTTDYSTMADRYNKIKWSELTSNSLDKGNYMYFINNYNLDNGDKIDDELIEIGSIILKSSTDTNEPVYKNDDTISVFDI